MPYTALITFADASPTSTPPPAVGPRQHARGWPGYPHLHNKAVETTVNHRRREEI